MRPIDRAFKRFQAPYGGDQEKRMTRWTNHVPTPLSGKRWAGYDPVLSYRLDVGHSDAGAEGLRDGYPDIPHWD